MGNRWVLDTNLLIDQQRGVPAAGQFVAEVAARNAAMVHPVTCAEMIAHALNKRELARIRELLRPFPCLPVRNVDFTSAIALLERHVLSVGVGWPDCLIAATCLRLKLPLVALNDRHFKAIAGLSVIRPY